MEQKMEKTRVGIIGTGNISNAHMEGYNALLDSVELAACCDLEREKAEAYAKRYGFAKVYTDYNEMLANEKLDAVSVCTWNDGRFVLRQGELPPPQRLPGWLVR